MPFSDRDAKAQANASADAGAEEASRDVHAEFSDEDASSEASQCLAGPESQGAQKEHARYVEQYRGRQRGEPFGTVIQKTQTLCTIRSGEFAPFIADGALCTAAGVFGRVVEVFGSSAMPFYACWFEVDVAVGEVVFGIPESFLEAELE